MCYEQRLTKNQARKRNQRIRVRAMAKARAEAKGVVRAQRNTTTALSPPLITSLCVTQLIKNSERLSLITCTHFIVRLPQNGITRTSKNMHFASAKKNWPRLQNLVIILPLFINKRFVKCALIPQCLLCLFVIHTQETRRGRDRGRGRGHG